MQQAAQDFTPTMALADDVASFPRGAPRLLQWLAAICFVFVIAAGAFPQLQMLLLGGNVPITPAIVKGLLILILGAAFFARGARCVITLPVALGALVLVGLGVSRAHILFSSHLPLGDLLLADYLMYFMLLLGCVFAAVPIMVSPGLLTRLLLSAFFISLAIGTAQHFLNNRIIQTDSLDGNFSVQAWNFYGQVRAFGLFPTPMQFGFFCCLVGNFGMVLAIRKRRRLVGWSMVVLAGFGCFLTLTRAAQICFCVGLPLAYVLSSGKPRILVRVLPIVALGTSVIVIGAGAARLTQLNRGDLTSSETLYIRLTEWKSYLVRYEAMPLADQVVGSGLVEKAGLGRVKHLANEGPTLLDNTYLALLVNVGVIGFCLVLGLYAAAWNVLSRKAAEGASTLMVATAVTFATLPFLANYEVVLNEVGMLLLLSNLLAF